MTMKIIVENFAGEKFEIPGTAFKALVAREARQCSDKTWRRLEGWSKTFLRSIAQKQTARIPANGPNYGMPEVQVDTWTIAGRMVERWASPASEDDIIYTRAKKERSKFQIVVDGEVIFTFVPKKEPKNDWRVIHRLSGQDKRRESRLYVANRFGHGATLVMNR